MSFSPSTLSDEKLSKFQKNLKQSIEGEVRFDRFSRAMHATAVCSHCAGELDAFNISVEPTPEIVRQRQGSSSATKVGIGDARRGPAAAGDHDPA